MDLMFQPLRKFADFNGRARRSEYWLFTLFQVLLFGAFFIVFLVLAGLSPTDSTGTPEGPMSAVGGGLVIVGLLVYLALLIPNLAVQVRRLHDINLSGWLVLLQIVPFGGLALLIMAVIDGTAGPNQYGPDPKARGTADIFT